MSEGPSIDRGADPEARAAADAACACGASPGGSCSDAGVLEDVERQAREALRDHAEFCAREAVARWGPVDRSVLESMLGDSRVVRFPTELRFSAERLQPGEFAFAERVESDDDLRYVLHVHPHFAQRDEAIPLLAAYHLVVVNYGDAASTEAAEAFGAALCGLSVEDYYRAVCALADELANAT